MPKRKYLTEEEKLATKARQRREHRLRKAIEKDPNYKRMHYCKDDTERKVIAVIRQKEFKERHKDEPEFQESLRLTRKKYYDNNKDKPEVKLKRKLHGIEFSITEDDMPDIPTHCPITGEAITIGAGNGKNSPTSLSLDRIDNTKGYIKGNIAIISFWANTRKQDMTFEHIEKLYNYVKQAQINS